MKPKEDYKNTTMATINLTDALFDLDAIDEYYSASRWKMDWEITEDGDLREIHGDYTIAHDRLTENDWILHLDGRRGVDLNTFIPAYFEACRRAGIRELKIITHY